MMINNYKVNKERIINSFSYNEEKYEKDKLEGKIEKYQKTNQNNGKLKIKW